MSNHHPRDHVLPQGNREGIRIRHIKENAGVTQNHPHSHHHRADQVLQQPHKKGQCLPVQQIVIDKKQNLDCVQRQRCADDSQSGHTL